jgi:hypothetical protein
MHGVTVVLTVLMVLVPASGHVRRERRWFPGLADADVVQYRSRRNRLSIWLAGWLVPGSEVQSS